jgi:hypothetical protein
MLGRRRVRRSASGFQFTLVPAFASLLAVAACSGPDGLMAPSTSPLRPTRPVASISDATQGGGNAHFYWLPPVAPTGTYAGTFDAGLQPTIKICRVASLPCTTPLVTIAAGSIAVDATAQSYSTSWSTSPTNITVDDYRAEVWIGSRKMGFADIRVVAKQKDVHSVPTGFVGVAKGSHLTLAFRLEFGIVASINIAPPNPAIDSGTTVQLSASAVDFHSQVIQNAVFTWSSAPASIASVNSAGLVTGVAPGTAIITAASGGVLGVDTITVRHASGTGTGGYRSSKRFTIDHTQVGGRDLTNFNVVVRGTFPELKSAGNGGQVQNLDTSLFPPFPPADFVVSPNPDGSAKYDFEIADYDATTGYIEVYFRVPTVSASVDGTFYFAFNDPSVTTYQGSRAGAKGEWDASYRAVYHFAHGFPSESTNTHAEGAVSGATETTGVVGSALTFAGGGDVVDVSSAESGFAFPDYAGPMTFEFWAQFASGGPSGNPTVLQASSFGGNFLIYVRPDFEGKGFATVDLFTAGGERGIPYPTDGAWHHYVMAVDLSGNLIATIDGVQQSITTMTAGALNPRTSTAVKFGNGFAPLVGKLDEVRFSNAGRIASGSVGYAVAAYNNQKSGSTFITVH